MLASLAYVSLSRIPAFAPEMLDLARTALVRNPALGVTGALYFDGVQFYQVIEGSPAAVEALFARIRQDPRHNGMQTLWDGPITRRRFGSWAMKFVDGTGRAAAMRRHFCYDTALAAGSDQEARIDSLVHA